MMIGLFSIHHRKITFQVAMGRLSAWRPNKSTAIAHHSPRIHEKWIYSMRTSPWSHNTAVCGGIPVRTCAPQEDACQNKRDWNVPKRTQADKVPWMTHTWNKLYRNNQKIANETTCGHHIGMINVWSHIKKCAHYNQTCSGRGTTSWRPMLTWGWANAQPLLKGATTTMRNHLSLVAKKQNETTNTMSAARQPSIPSEAHARHHMQDHQLSGKQTQG